MSMVLRHISLLRVVVEKPKGEMFRRHSAGDLITRLEIVQRSYKLIKNRGFGFSRFESSFECHNSSNHLRESNKFRVAPIGESYNSKNRFNIWRNFTTTKAVWKAQRTNQDKEKMKNYIFFSAITLLVCFCFGMSLTMKHHEDYVILNPEEEKK